MTAQMPLPLVWPAAEQDSDFIVSPANEGAVRHLEKPALWPVRTALLLGPRKSGRSLLGRLFVRRARGRLIDDAERKPEEELFHAWNEAQASGVPLLLVAEAREEGWDIALPDLRSRIGATPSVRILEPDDALIAALLERGLAARGLVPAPTLIAHLVPRIERSYVGVQRIVDALDARSLAAGARLSIPLARQALQDLGLEAEQPGFSL